MGALSVNPLAPPRADWFEQCCILDNNWANTVINPPLQKAWIVDCATIWEAAGRWPPMSGRSHTSGEIAWKSPK
jgi:hypothetical protein